MELMESQDLDEPCFSCGGVVPYSDGPTHRYMDSSPGCWQVFGEVLSREYEEPAFGELHRLTVDNYALQHPGVPGPQSIQSVGVHLISLCLVLERGADLDFATKAIRVAAKNKNEFTWLNPPSILGEFTVADVVGATSATEHLKRIQKWSESVWEAWSEYHAVVRKWLER